MDCRIFEKYDVSEPVKTATEFVSFREKISMQEFGKLNINVYVYNTPPHIEKRHKYLCDWFDSHTHRYPAIYGGGVSHVDSYPFRTQ